MIKNLITYIGVLISFSTFAQNLKTDVLVVGANPAGYAAAIQAAKSGVKTLLIDAGAFGSVSLTESDKLVKAAIYADFLKRVDSLKKDKPQNTGNIDPSFAGEIFKGWADTIKNLTLLQKVPIKKVEKSGKGWKIDLIGGREIKADVIVDASSANSVAKIAGLFSNKKSKPAQTLIYADRKYRTSVAYAKDEKGITKLIPLTSLILPDIENYVSASILGGASNLLIGQAAGATAAYCAYFKVTTKKLDVRKIQTELLDFNSRIIKFDDIADNDSSIVAFQHVGVTGIIKGKEESGKLLFVPDSLVSTEELRQPLGEYYPRSQIWFLDNKADKVTVEYALNLIKFLASRGNELNNEVQRAWKASLKLNGEFNLKKEINRRELAILIDTYLQPYVVAVDVEGNIAR